MTTPPIKISDEYIRFTLASALVQSGYEEADESDDAVELYEWHHCFDSANCAGNKTPPQPCPCSGVPYLSAALWTTVGPAVRALIAEEVEAAAPLIAAQVLRAYADKEHPHAEGVTTQTNYGTGIEYDAVCAGCGASWNDDEGGCTERAALLAAASGRERSQHEVDAEAWATGRLVHAEGCQINKTPPPGWPFDGFSCNCRGVDVNEALIAAQARERAAAFIDRAVARKRETAAMGLTADTVVANAWEEAAGWLRDASIWETRTPATGGVVPSGTVWVDPLRCHAPGSSLTEDAP